MSTLRHIEIFSAGCPVWEDIITLVKQLACPSYEITILDMTDQLNATRAKTLGIRTIPAVVIDGQPAECCGECGPSERVFRLRGLARS